MANDQSGGNLQGDTIAAEVKRKEARRRFLKQTTAAGSGIVILTFHHQRAMATGKTVMASSSQVCASMKGTVVGTMQVTDAANPAGPKVTATQCQLP